MPEMSPPVGIAYMSIAGSILIVSVLLLRKLSMSRLPPRFFVVLWDIVLARLLLPVAFPLPLGVQAVWVQVSDSSGTVTAGHGSAAWLWIWLCGAAVMAVITCGTYVREWNAVRDALPVSEEGLSRIEHLGLGHRNVRLLVSDRISAAVAGGVLRKIVVLPAAWTEWDDDTVRFVIGHELTHVAHCDVVQKILAGAAVCIHWYNPLVWLMRSRMDRDLERSCDEAVIRCEGEESRSRYAETILDLAAAGAGYESFGSEFSGGMVRERIISVLCRERTSLAAAVAGALVIVCSAGAFAVSTPVEGGVLQPDEMAQYVYDTDTGMLYENGELIAVIGIDGEGTAQSTESSNIVEARSVTLTVSPESGLVIAEGLPSAEISG